MPAELGGAAPATATLPTLPSSDAVDQAERDPASVRSLAVAKLRRAASLPRQKDGRRPASPAVVSRDTSETSPPAPEARMSPAASSSSRDPLPDDDNSFQGRVDWSDDHEEVQVEQTRALPPAATMFASLGRPVQRLQRSASVSVQHPADQIGRINPLPTLQDIQSRHLLQRSNSRTEAMARLTGERLSRTRPPSPTRETEAPSVVASAVANVATPPVLPNLPEAPPRPRLGRSFTISTGASGERRSVVGRRMMARLGNRSAAPATDGERESPLDPLLSASVGPLIDPTAAAETGIPPEGAAGKVRDDEEGLVGSALSQRPPIEDASYPMHEMQDDSIDLSSDLGGPSRPRFFTTPATPSRAGDYEGGPRELLESPSDRPTHGAISGQASEFENGGPRYSAGALTDSFEFSDLLRRTNSARTTTPHPPSSIGSAAAYDDPAYQHPSLLAGSPSHPLQSSIDVVLPRSAPRSSQPKFELDSPSIPILPPSAELEQPTFFSRGLDHAGDEQLQATSQASFPMSIAPGDALRAEADAEPMPESAAERALDFETLQEDSQGDDDDFTPMLRQAAFPRPSITASEASSQATPLGRSPVASPEAHFATQSQDISPSHSPVPSGVVSPLDGRQSEEHDRSPSQSGGSVPVPNLDRYADSKLAPFPGITENGGGRSRGASITSLSPAVAPLASGPKYIDLASSRSASPEQSANKISWLAKKFKTGGNGHDRKQSVDDGMLPGSPTPSMVRRPSAADSLRAEEAARSNRRPSVQDSLRRVSPSPSPSASATLLSRRPSQGNLSPRQMVAGPSAGSPSVSPTALPASLPSAPALALAPPLELFDTVEDARDSQYEDESRHDLRADEIVQREGGSIGDAPDTNSPADVVFTPKAIDILSRLDSILGIAASSPVRPSQLSIPPRTLLLHSPCLQVVNNNTAKDRYLFLFTDLLVIGKPILNDGETPTLDHKFIVKSIVELPKLKLSGLRDDDGTPDTIKSQHPLVVSFVQTFAADPGLAVQELVEQSGLPEDSVASMLFKTIELDRTRLGELLAAKKSAGLLRQFLVKFSFGGVRIDEALRIFLLSLRLPTEANAGERLLVAFAVQWQEANAAIASFPPDIAIQLVLAIMQLNDALNPTSSFGSFGFGNQAISVDDFIAAFRVHDPRCLVGDDLLEALYASIKNEKLSQALSSEDASFERDIYVLPTRIPSRLTYRVASDPIYITIPEPDPKLIIRLHGSGLSFDPPVLTFANASRVSFRVTGISLGPKTMLISRIGPTAPLYTALPISKSFEVMRAFMRPGHTFQLSFMREPTNTRRKYLFSFEDLETRLRWAGTLQGQIQRSTAARQLVAPQGPVPHQVREAAEIVALQVLRDALLPVDPDLQPSRGKLAAGNQRSASVSQVYPLRAGRIEADLDAEFERDRGRHATFSRSRPGPTRHNTTADSPKLTQELESLAASKFFPAQTGRQISVQCEQNSLIPLVLAFLQQGIPQPSPPSSLNGQLSGLGIS